MGVVFGHDECVETLQALFPDRFHSREIRSGLSSAFNDALTLFVQRRPHEDEPFGRNQLRINPRHRNPTTVPCLGSVDA